MRVLTSKDGDLSSYVDKFDEDKKTNRTWKEILIINHAIQAKKGKVNGRVTKEHIFRFCNTVEKVTKS